MNDLYQKFNDYLRSLSLRERVLMLLVGIAVIYLVWDMLFFSAYTKQQQAADSKIEQAQSEVAEIDLEIAEVTTQLIEQGNPNQTLKNDIDSVTNDIADVEAQLTDTFNSLVPPKEVTDFIRSLMLKNTNIELLGLNNEPVQVIEIAKQDNNSANSSEQQNSARLYKHATSIKLKTDYVSLYTYLTELEQSEWTLYWDQLQYTVDEYPFAEVTLRVYTLSTDEHWLGL